MHKVKSNTTYGSHSRVIQQEEESVDVYTQVPHQLKEGALTYQQNWKIANILKVDVAT